MARHRNVRSMNFSDEYDGFDDVYGHSVEDDYCMSPTDAAFMYDREGSRNQQKIGAFFKEIAEEDEREQDPELQGLSEIDRTRMESCIEQMKSLVNPSVTKHEMVKALLDCHFNIEKAVNYLLDSNQPKQTERKEKGDILLFARSTKGFTVPKLTKLNMKAPPNFISGSHQERAECNNLTLSPPSHMISPSSKFQSKSDSDKFSSLADLTNSHLQKVKFQIPSPFKSKNAFKIAKSDSDDVNKISKNISNIKLSDGNTKNSNVLNINESNKDDLKLRECVSTSNVISNDELDKIDLLKAIRNTKSVPLITKKHDVNMQDDFELPFVDCDPVIEDHKLPSDFCMFDCSHILHTPDTGAKKVSRFGKVLACKYKRFVPYIVSDRPCEIKRFSFDTPSPDDLILRNVKKR